MVLAAQGEEHERRRKHVAGEVDGHGGGGSAGRPALTVRQHEQAGRDGDKDGPDGVDDAGSPDGDDGEPRGGGCVAHVDDRDGEREGNGQTGRLVGASVTEREQPGHEHHAGGGERKGDGNGREGAQGHDAVGGAGGFVGVCHDGVGAFCKQAGRDAGDVTELAGDGKKAHLGERGVVADDERGDPPAGERGADEPGKLDEAEAPDFAEHGPERETFRRGGGAKLERTGEEQADDNGSGGDRALRSDHAVGIGAVSGGGKQRDEAQADDDGKQNDGSEAALADKEPRERIPAG